MVFQSSTISKNPCGVLSQLIGTISSWLILSIVQLLAGLIMTPLMNLITEATCKCKPYLLIMGDFNFTDINWEDWCSTGGMWAGIFSYPHCMTTSFSKTYSLQLGIEKIRNHLCLYKWRTYDLEHSFWRTFG